MPNWLDKEGPRLVRFKKKGKGTHCWVSLDKRWVVQKVDLTQDTFMWVLQDLREGTRYEKPTLLEACRVADRKVTTEASYL